MELDNTMARALSDAEQESFAAAQAAHERGEIQQREIFPGVWVLVRAPE